MKFSFSFLFVALLPVLAISQARLVMNGGNIVMQNGSIVVIDNSNPNAITTLNTSGGFIMNDATSGLRWNIGTTAGSYTVPYYFSGAYLPLSFTTSSGAGAGYFDLGTYNVPTWKNSDYLPPGVANVNRNGVDNSSHLVDRFWSIAANGYTTKPTLSNLVFTYRDAEWNAAGNSINENLLAAQRWNSTLSTWSDYPPTGTVNTTNNTVTIASLAPANLFQWWTLVDANFPLPLQLLSFKGYLQNSVVKLEWRTSMEINTKEFVVERSADRNAFIRVDTVAAAGNSNSPLNYFTIDPSPLQGVSFYRLKMIDQDNRFSYSPVVMITITRSGSVTVFPNPVKDRLNVSLGDVKATSYIIADALGKTVKQGIIASPSFQVEVAGMSAGQYFLRLFSPMGTVTIKVQKQD